MKHSGHSGRTNDTQSTYDENTGRGKHALEVEDRLRLASELVQGIAYDLAGDESPALVAELILMSDRLHKVRERRLDKTKIRSSSQC